MSANKYDFSKMYNYIIAALLIVLMPRVLRGQLNETQIDSLYLVLSNSKEDTNRVNTLNALSLNAGWLIGEYDTAWSYAQEAKLLSEKLNYKKGLGYAYNNLGAVYYNQSKFPQALKAQLMSLKFFEDIGDQDGKNRPYNDIGNIYASQQNYSEALKYYNLCLEGAIRIGNKHGMAITHLNIGVTHMDLKDYTKALDHFSKSHELFQQIKFGHGSAYPTFNIGEIHFLLGDYQKALEHFYKSLALSESLGDQVLIGSIYNNIGNVLTAQGNVTEGILWQQKALTIGTKLSDKPMLKLTYASLVQADSALGDFKSALKHHKLFKLYHDSILNQDNTAKIVQTQMQYEFDLKEAAAKAKADNELNKQKLLRNSFVGGFGVVSFFALVFFRQRNKTAREKYRAEQEKQRSEELLLNILPSEVADELKITGSSQAKAFNQVTVMFTDFKDFTKVSEKVSPELLVHEIHYCFSAFDSILEKYNIEKIKTIGDAYMCASGLPVSNSTHATDMVKFAIEVRDFMLNRKIEKINKGELPFELRIGIHTGPVVAGIVGIKKYAYDIWGDTVNIAARMEQNSETGKINISESTYALVKGEFKCEYRGKIMAKNKGELDMYYVDQA